MPTNTKPIFLFDPEFKSFIRPSLSQESPLEPGVFLMPPNATDIAPPSAPPGTIAVFDKGAWALVEDFRGQELFDQTTGAPLGPYKVIGPLPKNTGLSPPPPKPLTPAEVKAIAIGTIEVARDEALSAGVVFNGKRWHTDYIFQSQLTGIITAYGAGILAPDFLMTVRAMDNSLNQLTRTELVQLAAAVMAYVNQVYANSWAAKDALP